jgi:hypothetical protein
VQERGDYRRFCTGSCCGNFDQDACNSRMRSAPPR